MGRRAQRAAVRQAPEEGGGGRLLRIVSITGGAANMYCGSCLKDNAMAAELMRQGHDVVLVPFYTPTRTDEPNVSHSRVFFGGVSIYLAQKSALFRNTPRWVDRMLDAPWLLRAVSKRQVSVDARNLGELTVAMLEGTRGPCRKEIDKLTEWLVTEPSPDVISLPYALLIAVAKPLKEALGRPVCCGLQGECLYLDGLVEPYRARALELIREHVRHVDLFLPISEFYARKMTGYLGIPREKMQVVPMGINLDGYDATERPRAQRRVIGYMARVAPEKGLLVLVEALGRLKEMDGVALEAAGYLAPENRSYLAECERLADRLGVRDRFRYRGELSREEKLLFLREMDVLSVPCTYDEPKGLFLLEAMASGVPVVQPGQGSFPEIVERTGGGLLVEAGDAAHLAEGVRRVLEDGDLARELGRAGAAGVREHYDIRRAAARSIEVMRGVVGVQ